MTNEKLKFECLTTSVNQTISLGVGIAKCLNGSEVIALIGELGTGKTHLIKGIAQGLAAAEVDANSNARVTSPTFTLIQEYPGRLTLYHVDAYRLEDARQLEALGFDELCETDGVIVVHPDGSESKNFHVHDGAWIRIWKRMGLKTAIITGRECPAVDCRARDLEIDYIYQKAWEKKEVLEKIKQVRESSKKRKFVQTFDLNINLKDLTSWSII